MAQWHEVTRQQVYAWRHELKRKRLWHPEGHALFLPADLPSVADPEEVVAGAEPAPDLVEIVLRNGRQLRSRAELAMPSWSG